MVYFFVLLKLVFLFICVALGVGFYTLVEREVLSYIQIRKGPNKVGFLGLLQPLSDALKLFSKESLVVAFSFKFIYMFSPLFGMFIMFLLWSLYVSFSGVVVFKLGVLFFLVVSSLNVYVILLSGWSSNSKYSLLGAVRGMAQTISYEISMALILMVVLLFVLSFNFYSLGSLEGVWVFFVVPFVFFMWFVSCLAETNRAPFDLAEGESELVSGFNIEYGSGEFAFLFIAEYGSILFISMVTCCVFVGGTFGGLGVFMCFKVLFVSFLFLWSRGTFPRVRYDVLMSLTWKSFLVCSICSMFFSVGFGF